jgi:hypothetical protein
VVDSRERNDTLQTQTDNLTRILAAWGALLGTLGLGWTLYRDLLDRAKLQVSASVRRIGRSADGRYYAVAPNLNVEAAEKLFVVMTVVNVGRRPVMWRSWGGKYHKRRAAGSGFTIIPQDLPKMLREGEVHHELTELEADLRPASENVKKLCMWDVSGRSWALSRKQLKQLKEEACKAMKSSAAPTAATTPV